MTVEMYKGNSLIVKGTAEDVRSELQDMFESKYGVYPDLVEDEGDKYYVYLHTESFGDMTESENKLMKRLGISEHEESSTKAIEKALGVSFKVV